MVPLRPGLAVVSMSDALNEHLLHLPHGPEFRFLERVPALDPRYAGWTRLSSARQ
jgi:hypothetical protein